jgi:hypothetical protein
VAVMDVEVKARHLRTPVSTRRGCGQPSLAAMPRFVAAIAEVVREARRFGHKPH